MCVCVCVVCVVEGRAGVCVSFARNDVHRNEAGSGLWTMKMKSGREYQSSSTPYPAKPHPATHAHLQPFFRLSLAPPLILLQLF